MVLSKELDLEAKFNDDQPSLNQQQEEENQFQPVADHNRPIIAIRLLEIDLNTMSERQKLLKDKLQEIRDDECWMAGICPDGDSEDPYQMYWHSIDER